MYQFQIITLAALVAAVMLLLRQVKANKKLRAHNRRVECDRAELQGADNEASLQIHKRDEMIEALRRENLDLVAHSAELEQDNKDLRYVTRRQAEAMTENYDTIDRLKKSTVARIGVSLAHLD